MEYFYLSDHWQNIVISWFMSAALIHHFYLFSFITSHDVCARLPLIHLLLFPHSTTLLLRAQHKHFSTLPPTMFLLSAGLFLFTSFSFNNTNSFIHVSFFKKKKWPIINKSFCLAAISSNIFHSFRPFFHFFLPTQLLYFSSCSQMWVTSPPLHSLTPPCFVFIFILLFVFFQLSLQSHQSSVLQSGSGRRMHSPRFPRNTHFFTFMTAVVFIISTEQQQAPLTLSLCEAKHVRLKHCSAFINDSSSKTALSPPKVPLSCDIHICYHLK